MLLHKELFEKKEANPITNDSGVFILPSLRLCTSPRESFLLTKLRLVMGQVYVKVGANMTKQILQTCLNFSSSFVKSLLLKYSRKLNTLSPVKSLFLQTSACPHYI